MCTFFTQSNLNKFNSVFKKYYKSNFYTYDYRREIILLKLVVTRVHR